MDKGKFSQPRPYRDEEREIEEAFRQITQQGKKKQPYQPKFAQEQQEQSAPTETIRLDPDLISQETDEPIPAHRNHIFDVLQDADLRDVPDSTPAQSPVKSRKAAVAEFLFPVEEPEFEEDPFEEDIPEPDSFLDQAIRFCSENRKWVMIGLCAFALVLIISIISVFAFAGSSESAQTISGDVFIAGTNVNGMTRKQAISAVERATAKVYVHNDMVVDLAGKTLSLPQKKTGAELDVDAAVDAAFQLESSDAEHTQYIALLPYLNLNTDYIRQELNGYAQSSASSLIQTSYGLEGAAPELGVETFNENTAQTLVITMGTPGISFDVDTVYDQILDAYSMFSFLVTVTDVQPTVEPDAIDLQDVYEEFYIAPVDSTINMQTFEVVPGSYGYEFDLMGAQKLLEQAKHGEVLRIPMQFIEPKQIEENTLFRDILGEFQTAIPSDRARATNIRLSCEALNNTLLEPGESFSFNECIGKPSSGNGYKTVVEKQGNEETEVMGGGISQTATTLYNCTLLADLEIISRTNHNHPVDYVDYGLDATVSYGGADLKFRNNQNYPIRIEAYTSGNYVTVRILGTDERDYYVRMESEVTATHKPATIFEDFEHDNAEGYLDGDVIRKGITGYSVKTYKLKYSRQTGSLKTRDYEASSRYATVDMLVAHVAEPETTIPETTVPPTTLPPATVPQETLPPTETTVPSETLPQETFASETEPQETEIELLETQPQNLEETSVSTTVTE